MSSLKTSSSRPVRPQMLNSSYQTSNHFILILRFGFLVFLSEVIGVVLHETSVSFVDSMIGIYFCSQ